MSQRKMYFRHMERIHRITSRTVTEVDGGERVENVVQVLRSRVFQPDKWVDVDVEVVPSFAWLALACYGDMAGWVSKLHERWDQVIEQSPECDSPL